jgi:hypothetical protein
MRSVLVDALYELTGVIADDEDCDLAIRRPESFALDEYECLLDTCVLAASLVDDIVVVEDFLSRGHWTTLVVPARTRLERAYWPPRRLWRRTGRDRWPEHELAPALVFPFADLIGDCGGVLVRRRTAASTGQSARAAGASVVLREVWTGLRRLSADDWFRVGRIQPNLAEPWVYETCHVDPAWIADEFAIPDPVEAADRFRGAVARSLSNDERLRSLLLKWFD